MRGMGFWSDWLILGLRFGFGFFYLPIYLSIPLGRGEKLVEERESEREREGEMGLITRGRARNDNARFPWFFVKYKYSSIQKNKKIKKNRHD